jgi:hypothetical protein
VAAAHVPGDAVHHVNRGGVVPGESVEAELDLTVH